MSTISIPLSSIGLLLVFSALNGLGQPFDAPEPGVPRCPY
jgi:hypothetical protein